MEFRVVIQQPRFLHRRVDLGGTDIGVAEHFLNRPQVSASAEEVRGERMPQQMRFNGFGDSRPACMRLHHQPHRLTGNRGAAVTEEKLAAGFAFHKMWSARG